MRLRVTPVPIPNTMVKTQAADGTSLEMVRESRWPPGYKNWRTRSRFAANVREIHIDTGKRWATTYRCQPYQQGSAVMIAGFTSDQSFKHRLEFWWLINFSQNWIDAKALKRKKHLYVPWKLHIRNRNDKIFKYLNQDIRGNCYKQSNNYCLKKTDVNKIDLKPTPITLYRCSDHPFPWMKASWSC